MRSLPEELSSEEIIERLVRCGTVTPVPESEQRRLRRTIKKGIVHLILRNIVGMLRSGKRGRGTGEDIAAFYEKAYGAVGAHDLAVGAISERSNLFRVGQNRLVKMSGGTYRRFMINLMGDVLAACEPKSVCEVGCGRGFNLMHLASRFDSAHLAGFDISRNAVRAAQETQSMVDLPSTPLGMSFNISEHGMDQVRNIDFRYGSAFELPAADKSYDIVYTSAALEQMHSSIDKALSELRRVARHYVLMREPFSDGNDFLGRAFLWSQNYFRMPVGDLAAHGLEPIRVWTSLPVKPTFADSIVLCRVR